MSSQPPVGPEMPRMILLTSHVLSSQCTCGQHLPATRLRLPEHVVLWKKQRNEPNALGDAEALTKNEPIHVHENSEKVKCDQPTENNQMENCHKTEGSHNQILAEADNIKIMKTSSQGNNVHTTTVSDADEEDWVYKFVDDLITQMSTAMDICENNLENEVDDISENVVSRLLKDIWNEIKQGTLSCKYFKKKANKSQSEGDVFDWEMIDKDEVTVSRDFQYVGVYVIETEHDSSTDLSSLHSTSDIDLSDWDFINFVGDMKIMDDARFLASNMAHNQLMPGTSSNDKVNYGPVFLNTLEENIDTCKSYPTNQVDYENEIAGTTNAVKQNTHDERVNKPTLPSIVGGWEDNDMTGIFGIICNKSNHSLIQ